MIEIQEDEMYASIFYALRDYRLPDCTWIGPYVDQLYAQMMGWC